jgi:hypothetical protein
MGQFGGFRGAFRPAGRRCDNEFALRKKSESASEPIRITFQALFSTDIGMNQQNCKLGNGPIYLGV